MVSSSLLLTVWTSAVLVILMNLSTGTAFGDNPQNEDTVSEVTRSIAKRYLNWIPGNIQSDDPQHNIHVRYIKPHPRSDSVSDDKDYMAFVLYTTQGYGTFHFVDSEKAKIAKEEGKCKTMHGGAYYVIYGKCPQHETGLIASGFCYRHESRSLIFRSGTFNQGIKFDWLDGQYYVANTHREANPYEKGLLTMCFNNWKKASFPKFSWQCDLMTPSSQALRAPLMPSSLTSDEDQCLGCDEPYPCDSVDRSMALQASTLIITVLQASVLLALKLWF